MCHQLLSVMTMVWEQHTDKSEIELLELPGFFQLTWITFYTPVNNNRVSFEQPSGKGSWRIAVDVSNQFTWYRDAYDHLENICMPPTEVYERILSLSLFQWLV